MVLRDLFVFSTFFKKKLGISINISGSEHLGNERFDSAN